MNDSQGRPRLLDKFLTAGFLVAVAAVLLLPIWCVQQPPLLDYPNHLARTFVLSHLSDPAYQFGANFRSDWRPYPYVSMDLVLLALQHFLSPELAGKLVLSLAVLLPPLAAWWFLRQINRGHEILALFSGLVCYDIFFLEGFVNFQLALAVSLLVSGCWKRDQDSSTWRSGALTFLAVMLLYFTHLIVFGFTAILLTMAAFLNSGTGQRIRNTVRTIILFLPGCVLFLFMRPGLNERREFEFRLLQDKLDAFYQVPTHGFSDRADGICVVLLALCVPLAVWRNRELRRNGRWPWVWLAFAAIYFALPLSWGQTFDIDVRILPMLFLLCFCTFQIGRRRAQALAVVAVVLLGVRVADVVAGFRREAPLMNGLSASVADIPRNARVFPVVEVAEDNDPIQRPFAHYWAYATIRRGAFTPYLFDIPGQMPLRITSAPYAPDGFWDLKYPDSPDWPQVRKGYDYIWAYNVARFAPAIDQIADTVYRNGDLVLYRIRKPGIRNQPARRLQRAHLGVTAPTG
jgi:hypothetical protein